MDLLDFVLAGGGDAKGERGAKIPWDDPEFSSRMLESHLSQEHDWASRRASIIARHVDWIAGQLPQTPSHVLDIGCGPGFYTQALAALGHQCAGVDFSPAAIDYARKQAAEKELKIQYTRSDIREFASDRHFDCILMAFGEFNVFTRRDAAGILKKCAGMLSENGVLLLEVHTHDAVRESGEAAPSWQRHATGLFSDRPHLCLQENFWDASEGTALSRYAIIEAGRANVRRYASFMQAYTDWEYDGMLQDAGLILRRVLDADAWPAGKFFHGKLKVLVAALRTL